MPAPLHVLVYGSIGEGVCDVYRLGMYRDRLAALGVEMRTWGDFNDYSIRIPSTYEGRLAEAVRDGVAEIDRSAINWADVIVFRRWYSIAPACETCDTTGTEEQVAQHCTLTGHAPNTPDRLVPLLLSTFERHPEHLRGRAIVYETDDDLLAGASWLPYHRRLQPDRPIIERMLRRADLVTVTTPVLATMAGRYNEAVRVVRNAIDPAWYEGPAADVAAEGSPRILYYGTAARTRDYEVCREAVDSVRRHHPDARRVWLGAEDPRVGRLVDELHGYVQGVPSFARRLAELRPDIGLAPVVGDAFDRAHSELHWLEYSMAGAATIASRTPGGGPYDVIRDGVDGLLARNRSDWRYGLRRLAESADLRAELAGHARERVLAEYTADRRAEEWADAYRWAAEHGGRGALRLLHVVPTIPTGSPVPADRQALEQTIEEAPDSLAHRMRARADAAEADRRLVEARGGRLVAWPPGADANPLVSVIIPTHNRGRLVAERSIASVLAQTYTNLEVIVVGDGATPETVAAVKSVRDPRVRFVPLPERGPRPVDPERAWLMSGSRPYNHGLRIARGAWIAPQADDDEFLPHHIETLLSAAIEHRLEFVYGQAWMEMPDETWMRLGHWPPEHGGFSSGAVLYSASLAFMELDEECWREVEPNDWNLWRRMRDAGVRMGFVDRIVFRHYVEARHRLKAS